MNPYRFPMTNGWMYSVPSWIAYLPDMTVIEWNGIDPDVFVEVIEEIFENGVDSLIEYTVALSSKF